MNEIQQMVYSLQRFHILALYANTSTERTVSASYAYAWWQGIYPLLNDSAPWHKPHTQSFSAPAQQVAELHEFLTQRWRAQDPISFFQLEDRYAIRAANRPGPVWSQAQLIAACRYLHLHAQYDEEFWSALLGASQSPLPAEIITRPVEPAEIQFE
ncbi:MAG TPA: hypothetical protein VHE37_01730 [Nevskiaceae bacterium]|nr:hypothetical protein [Nevskiaceae bacterium]